MNIINPSYEIIEEPSVTKKIERIARVCYKSEDKIAEGTDLKMISNLIDRKHFAMLEHGDVCMEVSEELYALIDSVVYSIENVIVGINGLLGTPKKIYLRRTEAVLDEENNRYLISGNMRAWYEFFLSAASLGALPSCMYDIVNDNLGHLLDNSEIADMEIGVDEEEWDDFDLSNAFCRQVTDFTTLLPAERMVHETISVLFTVDRGVTHELVRMRDCSFAQESTRYCNYSIGKYSHEITVIEPCFFGKADGVTNPEDIWAERYGAWRHACEEAENSYFRITDTTSPAQHARTVLPTSVKADIVLTTNLREWKHIFNLRACDSTGPAHPQMSEIMRPLLRQIREGEYEFAFSDLIMPDDIL